MHGRPLMRLHACCQLILAPAILLCACGGAPKPMPETASPPPMDTMPMDPSARASQTIEVPLEAKSGSKLSGKATFTEVEGGVKVTIQVAGAPPGAVATHVHEKGDCSAPDAESAGGHFNPTNQPHGLPSSPAHHIGDFGN